MTNKEKYTLFCASRNDIPLYMRGWWLDCNCGAEYWDVLLYENNNTIEAFMLYYIPYKKTITMPIYTKAMGIWFNPSIREERYTREVDRKHAICQYFIDNLPPFEFYLQNFHHSFTDWLPFYWKGFQQTTRYVYRLPVIPHPDELWHSYRKAKRDINKARNHFGLKVEKGIAAIDLLRLNDKVFARQGLKAPDPESLLRLIEVSRERKQGDIWGAYDADGRLHAALFAIWQDECTYAIASGRDMDLPNSNASILLIWECICHAYTVSSAFDFQGSMLQGVEGMFRELGGIQYPYFEISKGSRGIQGTLSAIKTKLSNR